MEYFLRIKLDLTAVHFCWHFFERAFSESKQRCYCACVRHLCHKYKYVPCYYFFYITYIGRGGGGGRNEEILWKQAEISLCVCTYATNTHFTLFYILKKQIKYLHSILCLVLKRTKCSFFSLQCCANDGFRYQTENLGFTCESLQ